jgi:hypothetical protein
MKKILGFISLILIALLTACTVDSLDDIVEAGNGMQQSIETEGEVPVLLSIGSVAGTTELTRSPLETVDGTFTTPTGVSASENKYLGLFALAQSNLSTIIPAGSVTTDNIMWDGSVNFARLLWNQPTKATVTNQWNGTTVDNYTTLELMDPSSLNTTPVPTSCTYPNNNWYNYYFYTYYPYKDDTDIHVSSNNVVTVDYELDGSQDIITGYAMPPSAQANNGFCSKYFSNIKNGGALPFDKMPQLSLTHHLAQLRFWVKADGHPSKTFMLQDLQMVDVPVNWTLTIADKSSVSLTGKMSLKDVTTASIPIKTMTTNPDGSVASASADARFIVTNSTTWQALDNDADVMVGYVMIPTTAMIAAANAGSLNPGFNLKPKLRLQCKYGDDIVYADAPLEIKSPAGGFVAGKVYNIILTIHIPGTLGPAAQQDPTI